MSRYLNDWYQRLDVYTPGEQPQDRQYVKLNTNESPYPPAPAVLEAVAAEAKRLQLYSDPECARLRDAIAALCGVKRENVYVSNGSDDILNFAFMAFGGGGRVFFPDISYGFYKVFGDLHGVEYTQIPLREDFSIDPTDYRALGGMIVLANPNAPTGLALSAAQIEDIVRTNADHVVLIDEAYVDFGAESVAPLTAKYDNLLVVQTFSKSRSMAGARLGFAIADAGLIADLDRIKYCTNPYNVNRMTLAAGEAAIREKDYYMANCGRIVETRESTAATLRGMGFEVLPSRSNFIFVQYPPEGAPTGLDGASLYLALKVRGVLVRHFTSPRIANYLRVTIGTPEEMRALTAALRDILDAAAGQSKEEE